MWDRQIYKQIFGRCPDREREREGGWLIRKRGENVGIKIWREVFRRKQIEKLEEKILPSCEMKMKISGKENGSIFKKEILGKRNKIQTTNVVKRRERERERNKRIILAYKDVCIK